MFIHQRPLLHCLGLSLVLVLVFPLPRLRPRLLCTSRIADILILFSLPLLPWRRRRCRCLWNAERF